MESLCLENVWFGPVNVDLKHSSSFDMNIEILQINALSEGISLKLAMLLPFSPGSF